MSYYELRKQIFSRMQAAATLTELYKISGQLEDEVDKSWRKWELDDFDSDDLKDLINRLFTERSRNV